MNEDHGPMPRQDNVGPAGQRCRMQTEPESGRVQGSSDT